MVQILDGKELKGCSPKFSINSFQVSAREKESRKNGLGDERSYQRPPEILPSSKFAGPQCEGNGTWISTDCSCYTPSIKSATLCLIIHAMPFLDTRILVLMLTCRIRPVNPSWLDCFYARDCP